MKVKVLYFLIDETRGGVEEHVLSLIQGLDPKTFEVFLVCPEGLHLKLKENLNGTPCQVFSLHLQNWLQVQETLKLLEFLKKIKPHIVHSHNFRANFIVAPIARCVGVPAVIETVHLTGFWRKGLKCSYFLWDRLLSKITTRIIAVSHSIKKHLVEVKKINESKVVVIHNGRDLSRFKPYEQAEIDRLKEKLGIPKDKLIISVIGRLHEQKGHRYLIEAIPSVMSTQPSLHTFVVGDGPLETSLKQKTEELGISGSVTFTGFRENIQEWIGISDVIVLPSLYEGLPLTLIEAAATEKPVIATRVDGTPEIVVDGETGLLVPPRNPTGLAEAVIKILKDDNRRRLMGRQGRIHVMEMFDFQHQLEKTTQLYNELVLN